MSALPKSGSSTKLNNLTTLDTLHATKALQELRNNRAEASPQTSRSAPGEKSKYQLWPAIDQRVAKPLPGALEPPALCAIDRKRSIRVRQSAEQMWLYYRKGESRPPPRNKPWAKRTQSSPKNTPQPMLNVANITSTARTNRRSCSAPGRTNQNETLRPHEDAGTDCDERYSLLNMDHKEQATETGDHRRSLKRASSVVLPAELAAIVFPKLQRRAFDADGRKIEAPCGQSCANVLRGELASEIPPAVPPKTPPKKPTPGLHVSPLKLRPMKGPACDKALPQIVAVDSPPLTTVDSFIGQGESKHVRDGSGDSVIDRGRPMKRSLSQSGRGFMGSGNGSSVDLTSDVLPKGWSANSVSANLSRQEIRKLEHQARSQVGRFEVLHHKDVKALSQQVRLLDEQCEYLRGFAKSLRRNRRTLHAQTIAYLKSPALSEIPRQSILQKVETLADLDDTIDDWAKKLERAEDQRLRTRQRLLEHIAAVLAMPSATDNKEAASDGLGVRPEQTPPQSPEGLKSPSVTARYEAESIKIYAGSEMHALLGVLEKETAALNGMENVI